LESEIAPRLKALAANIRSIAGEVEPRLFAPNVVRIAQGRKSTK
jgi:hypothetical protein